MVRCNLSILLAEQNLKITKVAEDTGISRTTLTSLSNNYSQGIQFDTINTLCSYLKVTPDKLISFIPIDIKILLVSMDNSKSNHDYDCMIEFLLVDNFKTTQYKMFGYIDLQYNDSNVISDVFIFLNVLENLDNTDNKNGNLTKIINNLSKPFLTDLENQIIKEIINLLELQPIYFKSGYTIRFNWLFKDSEQPKYTDKE